jgi:hypothetical protein
MSAARKWASGRAENSRRKGRKGRKPQRNNPHAGFINDIKRLRAPIAAGLRRFGERRLGGNRRKLHEETLPSGNHPQFAVTDAFSAGGMGVAAMRYE